MKLSRPVLVAVATAAVLLVSFAILLAFPFKGPAPSWVGLLIIFLVVFAVTYARAKYERRRKRQ